MLIELFGFEVMSKSFAEIKDLIATLPVDRKSRKSLLLKEIAQIRGIELIGKDFADIGVY